MADSAGLTRIAERWRRNGVPPQSPEWLAQAKVDWDAKVAAMKDQPPSSQILLGGVRMIRRAHQTRKQIEENDLG